MKRKEHLAAVPVAADAGDGADAGKLDIGDEAAIGAEDLYLRRRILFILRNQIAVNDADVLQDCVGLRNELVPHVTLGSGRVRLEHAVAWRIFVAEDVDVAIENLAGVEEVFSRG